MREDKIHILPGITNQYKECVKRSRKRSTLSINEFGRTIIMNTVLF
jgi:hypothetical protein